jgi:hypothetical protein
MDLYFLDIKRVHRTRWKGNPFMNQKSPDDLMGLTFGRLRVIGAGQRPAGNKGRHSYLLCECACRRITRVSRPNLIGLKVLSCGVCIRANYDAPRAPASTPDALKFARTIVNR